MSEMGNFQAVREPNFALPFFQVVLRKFEFLSTLEKQPVFAHLNLHEEFLVTKQIPKS